MSSSPCPSNSAPLLAARGIAVARGERLLLTDLDVSLAPRDLAWLRGPNGVGKTTLLRVLAGLAKPRAGTIERAVPLLYLAHANALKDDLTVAESVALFARLFEPDATPTRQRDALDRCGLTSRRGAPIRTLSQGQRRRVALTRLAMSRPATIWLLDEPYDALDADGATVVDALLGAHARQGGCVLLTSHVPPGIDRDALREIDLATVSPAKAGAQFDSRGAAKELGPDLRQEDPVT